MKLEIGKLPADLLEKVVLHPIEQSRQKRGEIILRPKTGEDCSALDLGEELCVISTDPITGADHNVGYLLVHINCNDIASSGCEPVGMLVTILLPKDSTVEQLEEITEGIYRAAGEVGIEILGGHTEVTDAVKKPVLSGTVIGKSHKRRFITTSGAQAGQDIVMTKWAGIEGTAILAKDYEAVLNKHLPEEILKKALALSDYISVLPEAKIAASFDVTAMHDVTEGGIYGALWEIADCSGVGIVVTEEAILLREETKAICNLLELNPYRLISSGTMVMTCFEGEALVKALIQAGIPAAVIGKVTEKEMQILKNGQAQPLTPPESDELYQAEDRIKRL